MYIQYMKSNRGNISPPSVPKIATLHQELSREKENLVTMFLSSASHHELTDQIKKIDELCTKIDLNRGNQSVH
jgi:hypothetical protein